MITARAEGGRLDQSPVHLRRPSCARVMPSITPDRSASTSTERLPFHQSMASSPDSPGRSVGGVLFEDLVNADAAVAARARGRAAARSARRTRRRCRPPRTGRPRSRRGPGITPSRTTPQAPGMIGAASARTMWHDARAHDRHQCAGLGDRAPPEPRRGRRRWQRRPRCRGAAPSTLAACSVSRPAASPSRCDRPGHLGVDDVGELGIESLEERAPREAILGRPDRLVPRRAVVAGLDAA